jgi:hypothetical protein
MRAGSATYACSRRLSSSVGLPSLGRQFAQAIPQVLRHRDDDHEQQVLLRREVHVDRGGLSLARFAMSRVLEAWKPSRQKHSNPREEQPADGGTLHPGLEQLAQCHAGCHAGIFEGVARGAS